MSGTPASFEKNPEAVPMGIEPDAEAAVLALNNMFATELSLLDRERLAVLLRQSFHARRIGSAPAFLIALDQGADYDSPNYLWFRSRYRRFVYVDRVAVHPTARGRGLAKALYSDLIQHAVDAGHDLIACEINSSPPNPASDAFHAKLGFAEVGSATIHGGAKEVRYMALPITSRPAVSP